MPKQGLDVEFIEYPGGTGAMRTGLRNDSIDVAVALTEGLVAGMPFSCNISTLN